MFRSPGTRAAMAAAALAWGCSADGHTPDCPALPLYKIGTPLGPEEQRALDEAADKGCITPPSSSEGGGEGGSGGSN